MKALITGFAITMMSWSTFAATMTPMKVVEKSAYQLNSLVSKKQIDASYLTNISMLTVTANDAGYVIEMSAPSAKADVYNTLTMSFDKKGAPTGQTSNFVSAPGKALFTAANSSTIIDLGAEAIVDHTSESADLVKVSETAKVVHYEAKDGGIMITIGLTDGRSFLIQMDKDANVLSKGFN